MSRRFTIAAAVAVLFGGGVGIGSAPAAAVSCANAAEMPTAETLAAANAAIVCLVNAERAKRGIPRLTVAKALTRAAAAHSADMVERKYFFTSRRPARRHVDGYSARAICSSAPARSTRRCPSESPHGPCPRSP